MKESHVHFGSKKLHFASGDVHRVPKEWGEEQWIVNKEYCGKRLLLKKNRRCSMHFHKTKDEVFYLEKGKVLLEMDGQEYVLAPGEFVHVRAGCKHRFTGIEDSVIFEFSTTHDEEDSYRSEYSGHIDPDRFARQSALIKKFKGIRVLVVGDVMLDTYVTGSVRRVSPEAPIPVVRQEHVRSVLGGAANAAANVASLGGRTTVVGIRGKDEAGDAIASLFAAHGIAERLVTDATRRTTQKQRIMGDRNHQMVRVDLEDAHPLGSAVTKKLLQAVDAALKTADVVLLSDYGKGVLTPAMIKSIIAAAKKNAAPVILDPKPRDVSYLDALQGVSILTPNKLEAQLLTGRDDDDMAAMAMHLARRLKSHVLVTLGAAGMVLADWKGKNAHLPTHAVDVADVSGAGDTVAAVLALCIGAEAEVGDAMDIANRAAGIVVTKVGTATVSQDELVAVL